MPEVSGEVGDWERHLCAPLTGRRVVCAFEVLAAMTRLVAAFKRWGAERPLLIADAVGTGPLPFEADADIIVVDGDAGGATLTEQVRSRMRVAERITPDLAAAVDAYDPEGEAVWWVGPPVPNDPLLGRRVLGGRPLHQARLEDKTITDDLLEAIGVARAPAVVCPVDRASLDAATRVVREQSGGAAVVWSGDARDGINGGGDYVRWIGDDAQAAAAADFFAPRCDRVRVAAYLPGVPCSIHGIVLPDGVAVFRPVELASVLQPQSGTFFFGGLGTAWDPPDDGREQMRALARALGGHLAREHGYRGAFGVDGVLTGDGFRVTEFNPRFTGGLTRLNRAVPEAQLELVQVNALIGRDIGVPAAEVEAVALASLDTTRFVDATAMSSHARPGESVLVCVADVDGNLTEVADDSPDRIGTVSFGPSSQGAFVRLTVDPEAVAPGDRAAHRTVQLVEFANRAWGLGLPALSVP